MITLLLPIYTTLALHYGLRRARGRFVLANITSSVTALTPSPPSFLRMVGGKTARDFGCPECSHNFFRLVLMFLMANQLPTSRFRHVQSLAFIYSAIYEGHFQKSQKTIYMKDRTHNSKYVISFFSDRYI